MNYRGRAAQTMPHKCGYAPRIEASVSLRQIGPILSGIIPAFQAVECPKYWTLTNDFI